MLPTRNLGSETLSFLCYRNSRTAQLGSEPGSGRLAPGVPHHIAYLWTSLTFFFPNYSFSPAVRLLPFEMSEQNLHCVLIWLWQLFDQVLHSRDTLSWLLFWGKKKKKKRVESLHETESCDRVFWNLVFGDTQWHLVVTFKISGVKRFFEKNLFQVRSKELQ